MNLRASCLEISQSLQDHAVRVHGHEGPRGAPITETGSGAVAARTRRNGGGSWSAVRVLVPWCRPKEMPGCEGCEERGPLGADGPGSGSRVSPVRAFLLVESRDVAWHHGARGRERAWVLGLSLALPRPGFHPGAPPRWPPRAQLCTRVRLSSSPLNS